MQRSKEFLRPNRATVAADFYDGHAEDYAASTLDLDLTALYDRFTHYLPRKAKLLDAGSGSGRDTLAFLAKGYDIDAFDSSKALCELSARLTGVVTRHLRFQEFSDVSKYDGIWACASLLHVPKVELSDAIRRLVRGLKARGVLYMSFKHGSGERTSRDGRFYTDMTADDLREIVKGIPSVAINEIWLTEGEGRLKGQGEWLNAIVSKIPEEGQR